MSKITADKLRQILLFAGLGDTSLAAISRAATIEQASRGQWISFEGDVDVPFFALLQGQIQVQLINPTGKRQNLLQLSPGAVFHLPTVFLPKVEAPANIVCLSPVALLRIEATDFKALVRADSDLAMAVIDDLSQRLRGMVRLSQDLSLRSVSARLARFILAQQGAAPGRRWTHEDIAAQVGSVREVVSRSLKNFTQAGLIELQRQQIIIRDIDGLRLKADL